MKHKIKIKWLSAVYPRQSKCILEALWWSYVQLLFFQCCWLVGSSASSNTSVLHVSLAKLPLLLLANAEWSQAEEVTACFSGGLICSGIFGQNCLPGMSWYHGYWERLFSEKCHLQSSRGMLFASTSLPWCQVAQGRGNWGPAAFTGQWFSQHGHPRLHVCLFRKRARTREQSYKKILLKTG